MSDLCHFRTHRECGCPAGQCQPKPYQDIINRHEAATTAILEGQTAFFWRSFWVVFFICLLAGWADQHFKDQALEQQESYAWAR